MGDIRSLSVQAMQALFDLRENNQLCDATIVLDDGVEIPIHRALLCASSSYFRTAFTSKLNNKDETKVRIPGVSKDMMYQLLNYVYLRKMDVDESNVFDVLMTADYLGILGAMDVCSKHLLDMLTPRNCIGILLFARDHFCKSLVKKTWDYIMNNIGQIALHSEELLSLPLQDFKDIIQSDNLNVKNEETVWELILRWINKKPEKRKQHMITLIKCVRLGLMDRQFFMEKVKEHPYVTACEDSRSMVVDTLKFMYDLEPITHKDGEVATPSIVRPRIPHEILFAVGGWSGGSPTNIIETYDTRATTWLRVEDVDPAGPRAYHGTVVVGFDIYVIGGFDGMEYFNTCRCYDPVNKSWKEVAPMHTRRCYVSTTVLHDIIYAIGGYDGHHRLNSAEKYNCQTNQWSLIAPMSMQRSDASACTLQNRIYITGGFNGQECMHSAEVYNPDANQWTLIAAMRSRRSGVSCISYHNFVYVIGGFNGISRMCSGEKYNPQTNTWTPVPDMYNPRSNFAIEVIDDMIFAIGGFNGVTTIFHVECYDAKTNEWYEATDMNIYRSALSACVIVDLPNITDYIHQHRDKLMEEKRQKMIALENQRQSTGSSNIPNPPNLPENLVNAAHDNLQQLNILQQLNNNFQDENNNNNNVPVGPAPLHDAPLLMEIEDPVNEEDNEVV